MSAAICSSPSSKTNEDLFDNSFAPRSIPVPEREPVDDVGVLLANQYRGGVWEAGPRRLIHLGLGGILDEENKPPIVVEVSPAIGSIAVLDVMPFPVVHANVEARELTVKMMNRALDMLCTEFARTSENNAELVLPSSELRQRLVLEEGVKNVLKKLGIERNVAINSMKSLRFAEFKTADVLLLSIPEKDRAARSYLSGFVAPAAASVVPVVVADIEPYEDGTAGGFQIFGQPEFAVCRDNVMRLVSALEEVLLQCNYRACVPEGPTTGLRPARPKTRTDFKRDDRAAAIQEWPAQRISEEQARELEADLRARGCLL